MTLEVERCESRRREEKKEGDVQREGNFIHKKNACEVVIKKGAISTWCGEDLRHLGKQGKD